MLKVATIVQQIMRGLNESVSEDKVITITKSVMTLITNTRVHRPLEVIAFSANGITS
jgi:hypothetical protein